MLAAVIAQADLVVIAVEVVKGGVRGFAGRFLVANLEVAQNSFQKIIRDCALHDLFRVLAPGSYHQEYQERACCRHAAARSHIVPPAPGLDFPSVSHASAAVNAKS